MAAAIRLDFLLQFRIFLIERLGAVKPEI